MDQDSANGSPGAGKGSWRDRLGISKEGIPEPREAVAAPRPAAAARPAPLAPRAPVSRPAPLAPRAESAAARPEPKPAAAASPASRPEPLAPRPAAAAPANAASNRVNMAAASEGLAERLRAQREAAEKLAEQRLALARQRAAARLQETQAARGITPAPAASPASTAKFSFAASEMKGAERAPQAARPIPAPAPAAPPLRASLPAEDDIHLDSEPDYPEVALGPVPAREEAPRPAPRPPLPRAAVAPRAPKPLAAPRLDELDDDLHDIAEPQGTYVPPQPHQRPGAAAPLTAVPLGPRPPLGSAPKARPRLAGDGADEDSSLFSLEPQAAAAPSGTSKSRRIVVLVLAALLAAALLSVGLWFGLSGSNAPAGADAAPADVPLVSAPAEPVKTTPADPAVVEGQSDGQTGKKQIYDRILGDETQGEPTTLSPSEEAPVPQPAEPSASGPSDPALPPDANALPEPQPPADAPADGELLPVPQEPAASGQQGAADQDTDEPQSAQLPVPAEELGANGIENVVASELDAELPPEPDVTPMAEAPAPKPSPVALAVTPKPRPAKLAAAAPAAPASPQPASSQETVPAETASTSGLGYVVQLSAMPSEAEAKSDYNRIRGQRSKIVGSLAPIISKADLGTKGTVYRLSLGPLASKESATKLCSQLIAAGEKACIVRRQ